ncbi:MAG: MBL fold metallo-hydrolase, partial [Aliarcobacter sp.]|nr:MBL fold metallo-hydrolase [Aliarcobacter sp.]
MKKIVLISFFAIASLFANMYDIKPVKIIDDVRCVIGDINPPMKENNGFVSNMCYINIGDSIVVLD